MKRLALFLIFTALASATAVTSITCSGQTATVNATAHGLVASQGFSLSGTAGTFNSTASTVTTNALTFVLPAGTPCSGFTSGYTVIVPAKQIIDMNATATPVAATVTLYYLYWFTTQYPNPLPCNWPPDGATCPHSVWPGASAAETAALIAGTTVEVQGQLTVPAGTAAGPAGTPGTVQYIVISQYNAMQVGFAGFLLAGGYSWNGIAWVHQ